MKSNFKECENGYANKKHLSLLGCNKDFRHCRQPRNQEEVFNLTHSSISNVTKLKVWKRKWRNLVNIHVYPYKIQIQIVMALMALYNYIRRSPRDNATFEEFPNDFLVDVVLYAHYIITSHSENCSLYGCILHLVREE